MLQVAQRGDLCPLEIALRGLELERCRWLGMVPSALCPQNRRSWGRKAPSCSLLPCSPSSRASRFFCMFLISVIIGVLEAYRNERRHGNRNVVPEASCQGSPRYHMSMIATGKCSFPCFLVWGPLPYTIPSPQEKVGLCSCFGNSQRCWTSVVEPRLSLPRWASQAGSLWSDGHTAAAGQNVTLYLEGALTPATSALPSNQDQAE